MKKKLLIFISLLMLSIALVGCGGEKKETKYVDGYEVVCMGDREFMRIPSDDSLVVGNVIVNAYIYVDCETSVQYLVLDGYRSIDVTVLVDSYGNPILYSGEPLECRK